MLFSLDTRKGEFLIMAALSFLKSEEVEFFRTTVTSTVEDLMKRVANENDIFADYEVLLSGSTREDVRVGNPYEIDYLIQHDIKVSKIIEVPSYPGYVWVVPNEVDGLRLKSVMKQKFLSSNKLIFEFFKIVFSITRGAEYRKKEFYFNSSVKFHNPEVATLAVSDLNFRKLTNTGAAIPVEFSTNNHDFLFTFNSREETIDIVLSLRCHGYWPKCAEGWKRYKETLKRECYEAILEHGVSMVCKAPVKETQIFDCRTDMFRLSFSFAESKLFEFVTPEQKEAYKILKVLRDEHLPKSAKCSFLEKDLRDRFTSYHLKSVFFTLTIGNYEKRNVREWLVLLLKEIIVCLQKQSIKHHFIDGLELLVFPSEKDDFKLKGENYKYYNYEESDENEFFTSRVKDCKDLENIFSNILEKLPEDLGVITGNFLFTNKKYCIGYKS